VCRVCHVCVCVCVAGVCHVLHTRSIC
jgi:hypothetical protein